MSQYNHQTTVDKVSQSGFDKRFMNTELKILAIYYRDMGHPPKKRKELIYDLCEKHMADFNKVKLFRAVNSAVNHSRDKSNKFIVIDSIGVTYSEMKYIEDLDIKHIYKKILFTLISLNKLTKERYKISSGNDPSERSYFGSTNSPTAKYRELMKTSGVSPGAFKKDGYKNIHEVVHYFSELGLVKVNTGYIELLFIQDIPKDNDIAFEINDYDNIGLYYDLHTGVKNIKSCEECEKMMRVKSNRTKYCGECRDEKQRTWQRDSMSKSRNNRNVK